VIECIKNVFKKKKKKKKKLMIGKLIPQKKDIQINIVFNEFDFLFILFSYYVYPIIIYI